MENQLNSSLSISITALAVSMLSLLIATLSFTFGSGFILSLFKSIASRRANRRTVDGQIRTYLENGAVFLDGLPLFFEKTWNWGPSVPNYAGSGSFPGSSPPVPAMQHIHNLLNEGVELYCQHSNSHGSPCATYADEQGAMVSIAARFQKEAEAFCVKRWGSAGKAYAVRLSLLSIPEAEKERILRFSDERRSDRSSNT